MLPSMYNACLSTATFSVRWKLQRLVLLDKGKGPPVTSSSYRPLCLLDVAGKLYEKLLKARLTASVEKAGGLSGNQYGSLRFHSSITAVEQVLGHVNKAWEGNHRSRKVCIFLTFDVKNAFNSVGWDDILNALDEDFDVDGYICNVADDYFRDRKLEYSTTEGTHTTTLSAGVPQVSVLGPDYWILRYDDMLRMGQIEHIKLVVYADDIAGLVFASSVKEARKLVDHLISIISS